MNTRNDPFSFYAITIISFLESSVGTFVENLRPHYGSNKPLFEWLEKTWLPEELEHGKITKAFVERTWPDFNWYQAYADFYTLYEPRCHYEELRKTPGLEALARCVTESEATMIYRCLHNYSNDIELKNLMQNMSRDEVSHYSKFRKVFSHYDTIENNSFIKKARVVLNRSQLVRDEDLYLAFSVLNKNWMTEKPFREMNYDRFLHKAGSVMKDHFPVEDAKTMLFKPLRTDSLFNKFAIYSLSTLLKRLYPGMA